MTVSPNYPPRLHIIANDAVMQRAAFRRHVSALPAHAALHLRSRTMDGRALATLGTEILADQPHRILIINDRADIARAIGATGVHLPEQGLASDAVRRYVGAKMLIGRSLHAPSDVSSALEHGVNYVFLGPVWPTASHPDAQPLGSDALREAGSPNVIAIGGITNERVPECLRTGAHGVAVIAAIWDATDPPSAAHDILVSLSDGIPS